jgi:hypothetical protein
MWRKLALVTAVSLSVAAMPAAAFARGGGHGGGGGGHGFGGGGHAFSGGGRSFSPGFTGRSMPGGVMPGRQMPGRNAFVPRGLAGQHAAPLGNRFVTHNGRWAWNGHHRIHGRHIFGLIPGFGYGYYWYYGDCWIWTDNGWINLCVGWPY